MSRFWQLVAYGLIGVGVLMGAASLAGLVYFGAAPFGAARIDPVSDPATSQNVLLAAVHMLGVAFSVLASFANGIVWGLAIASFCGLMASVLLVLTGRGLLATKRWAKLCAVAAMPVLLLPFALLALILGIS